MNKLKPYQLADFYLGVMDDELYSLELRSIYKKETFSLNDEFSRADRQALSVVRTLGNSQDVDTEEYFRENHIDDVNTAIRRWTRKTSLWNDLGGE